MKKIIIILTIFFSTISAISAEEVKRIVVEEGLWNMTVTNNLPFTISSVDFTISNGLENLYTTSLLTEIDPYKTKSDPQDITQINPTIIDITENLIYSALITIENDQSGDEGVSCPDINNPPVYICNENPLSGLYNIDTCDENCNLPDCSLIYYCDGNINDAYPAEDCILPDESSDTPLVYICGTEIGNGIIGDGYYLTNSCGGVCSESLCNQLYYCMNDFFGKYFGSNTLNKSNINSNLS